MNHFFSKELVAAPARIKAIKSPASCRMDKNEQAEDVNHFWKEKALQALRQENWNRYPSADLSDIETKVAQYCGLQSDQITLSPGSASLITSLLNYFAINGKKIVITHPSYSLFEYHCNTYNIPFTPWLLNEILDFELHNLPTLDAQFVLIITSPNNPTGNSITKTQLLQILEQHPESLVIIDGVYTEFAKEDFTPLVDSHANLMVIRSFSKAFPIAGLRLGYLCANTKLTALVKKLMLPFSLNAFTLCFAREILFQNSFITTSKKLLNEIIFERQRMKQNIESLPLHHPLKVYNSEGNFLLIKFANENDHSQVLHTLQQNGIQILNTSSFTLLKNTLRVSIGSRQENDHFLSCLSATFQKQMKPTFSSVRYFTLPRAIAASMEEMQFN